jgi:hypothetical protein
MKKIVLSYSKSHFDPNAPGKKGGAGFLAQSIYRIINSKYNNSVVEYYDHTEHESLKSSHDYCDIFIGISNNIHVFIKKLNPRQSVLFAVNYSAISRHRIKSKAKDLRFDKKLLTWEDGIHSNLNELNGVTAVATLGNFSNFLSYVGSGVSPSRVFPVSCSLGHSYQVKNQSRKNFGDDILYFPGGVSFRKGVAYLRPIVAWMKNERLGRKLRVIGRATDQKLNEYMSEVMIEFPDNIVWEQRWIERDSSTWNENISKSRFAIFPSFEEGLPASVLDLIESDVPVLYSSSCGLDFVSRDVIPKSMDITDWIDLLRSTISRSDDYLSDLLARQKLMLDNLPKSLIQLEKILEKLNLESIWPSAEISESLKTQLPMNSWLLASNPTFDYKVYESDSIHALYSVNEVSAKKEISTESLIAIAIIQIDRYRELMGLTIQYNNRFLVIERATVNFKTKLSPVSQVKQKLDLFTVVDKGKSFQWPKIERSFILFKTRLFDSIQYSSDRFFKNFYSKTQGF